MADTVPSKPFSIGGLFEDPNFQLLLANMGKQLGGEGSAGAVIGSAAANMISSKAAQQAGEKLLNEDGDPVTRKLGPITPRGQQGPNVIKSQKNGSLLLDVDHDNPAKLVADLGGYTPLGSEGVNSITRSPTGSFLVNYDPPRRNPIASEVDSMAAAPTAARNRNNLSYTPVAAATTQADVDSLLDPYLARRSL
jgi:hypothetical protein